VSNGPLTRKQVCGTFTATFEGSYIPKEDIDNYLTYWLDSGLEDRDDLRGWSFDILVINETPMEEEE
jgi:hypothetical protein